MGLDRWNLLVVNAKPDDPEPCKASCLAMPEYTMATLTFDLTRLETGDDLEELVVHEMAHCLTWGLANVAETLAGDDPKLREWVRLEEERATCQVAESFLRMRRA